MNRNVAIIAPVSDLQLVAGRSIYLAEGPIALADVRYRDFHTDQRRRGAHLILDNGAAIGKKIDDHELLSLAERMQADEVVVPDVMTDQVATRERALAFMNLHPSTGLMFVPQGRNIVEWAQSLHELEEIGFSHGRTNRVIYGVGKHMHDKIEGGRRTLVHNMHSYTFHLLGASNYPLEDLDLLVAEPNVRSWDTSLPFVLAQMGLLLEVDKPVERKVLNFFKSAGPLGEVNLRVFQQIIGELDRS